MKFKSQIITTASGSIGGSTFSRNKGGMYIRARSTPVNPDSFRQQQVRSAFGACIQRWNTLTDLERSAWENYAKSTPVTNVFGDQILLSGQQMFTRANVILTRSTGGFIADAPTINNTGTPVSQIGGAAFATGTLTVTIFVAGGASTDGDILLQVGRSMNAGQNFYKGPYQSAPLVPIAAAAVSGTPTIDDTETDYPIIVGTRLPVRLRILYDDGRLSQPITQIVTVA